jgi:phosphatidylglycerol lysyltransferase
MHDIPRARALVLRHGWNATAYQIVNPGIEHWFSARGDAVVGFVRRHRVRVVAGGPICARGRLSAVVAEWEQHAARAGERVCYFGAAGRIHALLSTTPGYATVVLGAQPVWKPARWHAIIERHASLRAQLHRACNKGVEVREWSSREATAHPELQECLEEWLATRGLPPLHFLVEPRTLAVGRRRTGPSNCSWTRPPGPWQRVALSISPWALCPSPPRPGCRRTITRSGCVFS